MSFSSDVRKELIKHYTKNAAAQKAELAAIMMFNSKGISWDSENKKYIYTDPRSSGKDFTENRKTFNINGEINLAQNLAAIISKPECKRAFLRGAFIAGGTISDPKKDYHFEITAPDEALADTLINLLGEFDITGKVTVNRYGRPIVYVKESENISLILNVMEATRSMMEFENIHIERELRGAVNRKVNCDTANINKTISAGAKQIKNIELIRDTVGFDDMEDGLREICMARLENPDASLTEIGEMLTPKISKSGANHRLRKINKIAEDIRKRQK